MVEALAHFVHQVDGITHAGGRHVAVRMAAAIMRARSLGNSFFAFGTFGPGGENVVMPPYGVRDDAWMPVFAYCSLS